MRFETSGSGQKCHVRLVSPATDFSFGGIAGCIGAIPLFVLAFEYGSAGTALYYSVFITLSFGVLMYLCFQRGRLRDAVARLTPAPAMGREERVTTLRRAARLAVVQLVVSIALALAFDAAFSDVNAFAITGGIAAGMGLTNLLTAHWLRAWEGLHRDRLLAVVTPAHAHWRRRRLDARSRPPLAFHTADAR